MTKGTKSKPTWILFYTR